MTRRTQTRRDLDLASELAIAHGQVVLFLPRPGHVEGDLDKDKAFSDFWLVLSLAGVSERSHG